MPQHPRGSHPRLWPHQRLDAVLQAVLDIFQAQHGDAAPQLDPHTRSTVHDNVLKVFNQQQRRTIEHKPFSILDLQRALERLRKGVVPGIDRLRPEAYQRLPLPIRRRPAACLWEIPLEWANLD